MSKKSPFDYVKSINQRSLQLYIMGKLEELKGTTHILTNACFSMHMDTHMLAEEMNQGTPLSPELQYEFYYYGVRG